MTSTQKAKTEPKRRVTSQLEGPFNIKDFLSSMTVTLSSGLIAIAKRSKQPSSFFQNSPSKPASIKVILGSLVLLILSIIAATFLFMSVRG